MLSAQLSPALQPHTTVRVTPCPKIQSRRPPPTMLRQHRSTPETWLRLPNKHGSPGPGSPGSDHPGPREPLCPADFVAMINDRMPPSTAWTLFFSFLAVLCSRHSLPTLERTELRPREGRGPPRVHPWARSEAPGWDCDMLTNLEFSDWASPRGPSPSAPVFSPLPGSCSVLGVTLLTCPRSKAWTLWGCDPSRIQGTLSLCLCEARMPAALGTFQPGASPGARRHWAHAWAGANTHLKYFPKEITSTMGSSNCPQHGTVTERSSSFSSFSMYKYIFQSSLFIHIPDACIPI